MAARLLPLILSLVVATTPSLRAACEAMCLDGDGPAGAAAHQHSRSAAVHRERVPADVSTQPGHHPAVHQHHAAAHDHGPAPRVASARSGSPRHVDDHRHQPACAQADCDTAVAGHRPCRHLEETAGVSVAMTKSQVAQSPPVALLGDLGLPDPYPSPPLADERARASLPLSLNLPLRI